MAWIWKPDPKPADYCPVCHMNRNDDHPRDGTYKCWCHECDHCGKIMPEGADFVCDECRAKGKT